MEPTASAYDLLGVPRSASDADIRNAYKNKAMMNHPDRGGSAAVWAELQKAYDVLSDPQRRAQYDASKVIEGSAEKQFAAGFVAGADGKAATGKSMDIGKQVAENKEAGGGALAQQGYSMSHTSGFEAWLRNQKGLGKSAFYTAEDLLRARRGVIEASDADSTLLPPLTTAAVCYERHGKPEDVLYVDRARALPEKLAHGEVLVHMLAACVNDEDLLRVQTSLSVLNEFAPFNRTNNKWEEEELPATVGIEGVGVVLATAQNVPALKEYALEVKDWVVVAPDARKAPVGSWSTLCVCDSSRLIKVAPHLLPLGHYACSRALCAAYRLLEDYGEVKPGDTIIQNAADQPIGQAVVQLCRMLKIRTINLLPDDASFHAQKEMLAGLGATVVLKDNTNVVSFLKDLGTEMPRLALDGLGGDAGRRLAVALRPGGTLVVHAISSGQVPQLSPSLVMYQQLSLHGFNLSQWVADHGHAAYAAMLDGIGELVQAEKLHLHTRALRVADLTQHALMDAIRSHKPAAAADEAALPKGGGLGAARGRSVLYFGDEASANEMYFDLQAAIRKLNAEANAALGAERHPNGAEPPSGASHTGAPDATGGGGAARAAAGDCARRSDGRTRRPCSAS